MDELQPSDPRTLGQYTLLSRLGSGGFGIVYLAVTPSGQQVAIKVLRAELADDQRLRARLAREARAISAVDGSRTAKVFEVVTDGPFAYLVMEYVQGESLDSLVLQDRKPEGPLLWFIGLGLVEALQEIHAAGITHRDLKPSNVIVGPDGVKVVDFGISAITDEAGFTQTGTLMGSAAWLSPEQVTGTLTDQRTDIFNLGLTLAFLATGEHPFGDGRPDAVMYRITAQAPNLDSILSPLRIAIQKCLQKNPSDRPTLEALERFFSAGGNDLSEISLDLTSNTDTTFIVQPDAVSAAAYATGLKPIPPSTQHIRAKHSKTRIKTVAASLLAVLVVGVLLTLDATNAVDLGVIGNSSELANPPDAELTVKTTTPAPPTTIKVARTTTTTEPPPPAFQLYEWEGRKLRWNPCDGPIEILLNPTDKLNPNQIASLGRFLQEKASEITEMSGIAVFYAGITDKKTNKSRETGEEIIIQIDEPGNGILSKSENNYGTHYFTYGRTRGDFRELNVFQIQINSLVFKRQFKSSGEIDFDGQRVIMAYLGIAMGLDWLDDKEANAFGLKTVGQKQNEVLYWGTGAWFRTTEPKWGPGDKFGMLLVGGVANGCF